MHSNTHASCKDWQIRSRRAIDIRSYILISYLPYIRVLRIPSLKSVSFFPFVRTFDRRSFRNVILNFSRFHVVMVFRDGLISLPVILFYLHSRSDMTTFLSWVLSADYCYLFRILINKEVWKKRQDLSICLFRNIPLLNCAHLCIL